MIEIILYILLFFSIINTIFLIGVAGSLIKIISYFRINQNLIQKNWDSIIKKRKLDISSQKNEINWDGIPKDRNWDGIES